MFQKFKRMCRKAKKTIMQVSTKVRMLIIALLGGIPAMAQSTAGDYSAGTTALSTVAEEIVKYVPVMVKLCYAIAGVVAIIGAISVYIAMEQRGTGCQEEDYDGSWGVPFLDCGSPSITSVLRN